MYVKRVIRNGNRIITYLIKKPKEPDRSWRIWNSPASVSTFKNFALPSAIVLFGVYAWNKQQKNIQTKQKFEVNEQNKSKSNKRKSHFESYASFVLEDGQFLMTPRDFIDSIVYRSPTSNLNSKVNKYIVINSIGYDDYGLHFSRILIYREKREILTHLSR